MDDREKVIKGLECTHGTAQCSICPYDPRNNTLPLECMTDLAKDALELLKAQEPKPPRFMVAHDKIFSACDNCGKSLLVVFTAEGIKSWDNMPKYCPECGQAVKWDG